MGVWLGPPSKVRQILLVKTGHGPGPSVKREPRPRAAPSKRPAHIFELFSAFRRWGQMSDRQRNSYGKSYGGAMCPDVSCASGPDAHLQRCSCPPPPPRPLHSPPSVAIAVMNCAKRGLRFSLSPAPPPPVKTDLISGPLTGPSVKTRPLGKGRQNGDPPRAPTIPLWLVVSIC